MTTNWINTRTDLAQSNQSLFRWPIPQFATRSVLHALGSILLITLLIQLFTGLLLCVYYLPSPIDAYNSVDYITYQIPMGWLIRSIHHYNASVIVMLVFLHTLRTFAYGAYKKPRELTWLSGIILLVITLGFAFTGYLLPWDQRGYWATTIGIGIAGKTPMIGETIALLLQGGPQLGQLTLTRFYIIHVAILPLSLIAFTLFHLQQHRKHGVSPPITNIGRNNASRLVPHYPHRMFWNVLLSMVVLAGVIYVSQQTWAPLDFPADPTNTSSDPRPEWYFLFLYQLLSYVPGWLEPYVIALLPLIGLGGMAALPFVDRKSVYAVWKKPVILLIGSIYVFAIVILTVIAIVQG